MSEMPLKFRYPCSVSISLANVTTAAAKSLTLNSHRGRFFIFILKQRGSHPPVPGLEAGPTAGGLMAKGSAPHSREPAANSYDGAGCLVGQTSAFDWLVPLKAHILDWFWLAIVFTASLTSGRQLEPSVSSWDCPAWTIPCPVLVETLAEGALSCLAAVLFTWWSWILRPTTRKALLPVWW